MPPTPSRTRLTRITGPLVEELPAAAVGAASMAVAGAIFTPPPLLNFTTSTLPSRIHLIIRLLIPPRTLLPSPTRLTRNSGHQSMATCRMPRTCTLMLLCPSLLPTTIPTTRRRHTPLPHTLSSRPTARPSSTGIPTRPLRSRRHPSTGLITARHSRGTMPTAEAAGATTTVLHPSHPTE